MAKLISTILIGCLKFESDLMNYATDEAARNRINNFLASEKLLFSSAVKENATLGGANTNKVYDRLLKSLQSSEVYPILKDLAKYQLPQGYAVDVGNIFQQKLNEATLKAKNMPAYKVSYFNTNADKERNLQLSKKLDKKTFKSASEMKAYYQSLSPEDKIAFKRQQLGGQ